ncbi:MAG: signal peptidase II [Thermoleophilia bacterium]|nr:signal peptidase II [Thermoleophilia bacterium]
MPARPPTPAVEPLRPSPSQSADVLQWTALVVIALVTIVADQVTKLIARNSFSPNDPFEVLPFFHFTNTINTGIAFGQFRDNQIIVIAGSVVAIVFMLVYFGRSGGRHSLLPVAIGLLAGGATSNLFDRITQGHVSDFLEISRFPVFNLADVAITAGVIGLLITLISSERAKSE